jgi:hypothetical protein
VNILLDCSPKKLAELTDKYDYPFMQLRTPLSRHALADVPWALDNGCFSSFREKTWRRMVMEAGQLEPDRRPMFVTLPDIVGSARRTLELFNHFNDFVTGYGLNVALVLQNGIGDFDIPWHKIAAVFVGGDDAFKIAPETMHAVKAAKIFGKWVHVGRVNGIPRASNYFGIADSIDGTGLSKEFVKSNDLEKMVGWLKNKDHQRVLNFDSN